MRPFLLLLEHEWTVRLSGAALIRPDSEELAA
jgi:hypothetical protein